MAEKFHSFFLIQDAHLTDLGTLIESVRNGTILDENHVKAILYNTLCAINFVHSSNVMHRNITPAHILVDGDSNVRLTGFGCSRTVPKSLIKESPLLFLKRKIHTAYLKGEIDVLNLADDVSRAYQEKLTKLTLGEKDRDRKR